MGEGIMYESLIVAGVVALIKFLGSGMSRAMILRWMYENSDKRGSAYTDRVQSRDDQPQ